MKKKKLIIACLAAQAMLLGGVAVAEEVLEAVDVTADTPEDIQNKKIGETVKTAETLTKQQVQDTRDLVKYETGVTVVEKGRMGSSGYAIRGVDENRVNITVDGLHQAENLSSQGFQELFEGYGNFNNTRNGIEVENIKEVNIAKGADSTKVGSGALGGSVIFETKDARDYLLDKDWYYGVKAGYSTANDEAMLSHTAAVRIKDFDALLVRTNRNGNELENFGYDDYKDYEQGRARRKADPYSITKESTLFKLSYNPNENNRFTFMYDDGKKTSKGTDWSYTLNQRFKTDTMKDRPETEIRHANDSSSRKNISFGYENYDENPLWDSLKLTASKQKISQRARTDEYCEAGTVCDAYKNSAGVELKFDGDVTKVVDKHGGRPDYLKGNGHIFAGLRDSHGEWHEGTEGTETVAYNLKALNEIWFYCQEIDCNKKIEAIEYDRWDWNGPAVDEPYKWVTVNLDDHYFDEKTGKEYARSTAKNANLPIPNSRGWLKTDWKDRSLNTDIKQVNLDLSKDFETNGIEHNLNYGVVYSEAEKSMINYAGTFDKLPNSKVDWWVSKSTGGKECTSFGTVACPFPKREPSSFLIPVKVKTGALYFDNNIRVNDWLSFDAGYRYDRVSYKPTYEEGKTPKVPKGMITIKPLPEKPTLADGSPVPLRGPEYWDTKKYPGNKQVTQPGSWWPVWEKNDPNYIKDLKDYNDNKDKYDKLWADWQEKVDKNPEENAKLLGKHRRHFSNHSYSLGATVDPTDYLRVQAKYSKGFRAPTADEMYFTFNHPSFRLYPGLDLRPEIAKTKELAFTLHKDNSYLTLSGFQTDYKDFIELKYRGREPDLSATNDLEYDAYQNVNRSKAKVYGFEVDGRAFLGDFEEKLDGVTVGYKYTHQKGKIKGEDSYHPMNAIQPDKHVASLGYVSPEKDYGVDLYWTHVASKKAKDTYNQFYNPSTDKDDFAKYRSQSYNIFDLIGFYKPTKNLTLRAGVYNLFNKDYMTWDSARSIRSFGTSNMVCQDGNVKSLGCEYARQGIERFHSPERNYKINLEYKF